MKLLAATIASLALIASASVVAQELDIKRNGSRPSNKGPAETFTGAVRVDPLFAVQDPSSGVLWSWRKGPCAQDDDGAASDRFPTSTSPFHIRASMSSATSPIALITVMPRKACWPNLE